MSCCTLEIHDEKAAITIFHLLCSATIFSSATHTFDSLIECHFLREAVESESNSVTHFFPNAPILERLAGSSITGSISTLKSPVCINVAPPGEVI